jgi:GNAT superfamily N-acetyltransferase
MSGACATGAEVPASAARAVLRDGSVVHVREVRVDDAALLVDCFKQLSPHSRRQRFLTAKHELTAADLRYLTDLDHHDHEAIAALSESDGRCVGVARYVRSRTDPRAAEAAIAVADAWHHRGLATHLLARLIARAHRGGIRTFLALMSSDNDAMIGLLRGARAGVRLVCVESDSIEYEISLAEFATTSPRRRFSSGVHVRRQPQR